MREIRPETTPMRVMALCKLAAREPIKEQKLTDYIEPVEGKSVSKIISFLVKLGMVKVDHEKRVTYSGDLKMLESEALFAEYSCELIMNHQESFVCQIVQEMLDQSESIIRHKKIPDIANYLTRVNPMVNEEFVYGLRFWLSFWGIASELTNSNVNTTIVPIPAIRIKRWILKKCPKHQTISIDKFLNSLFDDCPELEVCFRNGKINSSLTSALRVLENAELIKLNYAPDATTTRELSKMASYPSNRVSEVEIMGK